MDNGQIENIIRQYIPQVIHMSLATVADNKPWVCEVHFLNQKPRGVYFEGQAHKLEGVPVEHPAYQAYAARFGVTEHLKKINGENGPRLYQLLVSDWYLFDAYNGPSQKYRLNADA